MDEAERHGVSIDERHLARRLGVPVVPTIARSREGLDGLLQSVGDVATGRTVCRPQRRRREPRALKEAADIVEAELRTLYPGLPNARWVAHRLLDGDERIVQALRQGELGDLSRTKLPESNGDAELQMEATA